MTPKGSSPQDVFAADKLVGLIFMADDQWCYFRADCGFDFNWPHDPTSSYALIDPETEEFIGIRSPNGFTGFEVPPLFRVFLLRPLQRDISEQP